MSQLGILAIGSRLFSQLAAAVTRFPPPPPLPSSSNLVHWDAALTRPGWSGVYVRLNDGGYPGMGRDYVCLQRFSSY